MRVFRRSVVCLLLAVTVLTGCSGTEELIQPVSDGDTIQNQIIPAVSELPAEVLEGHEIIAQNENYSLFLNRESLSIVIRENISGRYMTSAVQEVDEKDSMMWRNFTRSGIAIEYYAGTAKNTTRADMFLQSPEKTVIRTENGFAAHIQYKDLQLEFDVIVTLDDSGITAEVPAASIKEGQKAKLASIYLFPFMGYTVLGETAGYMLIPDGCGALIDLKDNNGKYTQPYSAWVYGSDLGVAEASVNVQGYGKYGSILQPENRVVAPVFGMVHTEEQFGFLGIVEEGNFNAKINAYPNGVITQYNWIAAQFVYRQPFIMPTSQSSGIPSVEEQHGSFDAKVRFVFTTGNEASYSGLASAYREYLTQRQMLPETETTYRIQLDFFGGDVEEGVIGTKYVPMTTVSQLRTILQELSDQGVEALTVYRAWQKGGAFGDVEDTVSLAPALGTRKELGELINELQGSKTQLQLYTDLVHRYNTTTSKNDVIYRLNEKRMWAKTQYAMHDEVVFLTPVRTAEYLSSLSEMPLALDGLTRVLYSFRQGENMISRQQAASILQTAMDGKQYAMYAPMDYQWGSTSDYCEFPLYGSNFRYVAREIPFFSMVLGGNMRLYSDYVNFQADRQVFLLRLVEMGVYPSFLLTAEPSSDLIYTDSKDLYTTYYPQYEELILQWDAQLSKLYEVAKGGIVAHTSDGNVAISTYANGAKVIVNYTDTEVNVEGVRVAGNSFAVKGSDA